MTVPGPESADPVGAIVDWVGDRFERPVTEVAALVGGMSSTVLRCRLSPPESEPVVVRHIDNADWLAREPDLLTGEARALAILADAGFPAPRLLAVDSDRAMLTMSFVEGEMIIDRAQLADRGPALAELAAAIAEVPEPPGGWGLRRWRPWYPSDPEPPSWGDRGLWSEAIKVFDTEVGALKETDRLIGLEGPDVLVHRDLHPLNVLWPASGSGAGRDRGPAVVDWVNACVGHPHAELAHCRWNLAVTAGFEAADAFIEHYLAITDHGPYDPRWDVVKSIDLLPGPVGVSGWQAVGRTDLTSDRAAAVSNTFLVAALRALDRGP